jgi:hypothetical protein
MWPLPRIFLCNSNLEREDGAMSKRGIEQVIGDDAEQPRVRETIAVQVCANNKHKPVPEY